MLFRSIDSIIGLLEHKFNPNHDPDTGRFAEGSGLSEKDTGNIRNWEYADSNPSGPSYDDMRNPKTAAGRSFGATLSNCPDYNGTTYRGLAVDPDSIGKVVNGNGVTMKLYSSSSIDENVAMGFMNDEESAQPGSQKVLMKFTGSGKNVTPYLSPELQDTKEVVLMPGTQYKFTGLSREEGYLKVSYSEVK